MKYRWCIEPAQTLLASRLAQSQKISPLLAQCLINRGITDEALVPSFLDPRLKNLLDPFLLPGMEAAVERLFEAREKSETMVVFGDYDVDGVTATALLIEVFSQLGWKAHHYLPHRRDEGYGLTADALKHCQTKHQCGLLLAVDCGSNAFDAVSALSRNGVDVIVLDHHEACHPLPPARAIVNPHAHQNPGGAAGAGAPTPFLELCSAGLAFKLAHALVKRGREKGIQAAEAYDLRPLLDLVALGTIADVVPLRGENRVLVAAGLERLGSTARPGLVALKQIAQCPVKVGVYEAGFHLAPRLNAAGRLETAEESLDLLRAGSMAEAVAIAGRLNQRNQERQAIERGILERVVERVERVFRPEENFVIVEGDPDWHIGVVGIVASRILQKFYRPTIILGGDGGCLRGSGRSVQGFNLAAALRECGDLLLRHGGHAMAAGVTIQPGKLEAFRERLNGLARASLTHETLQPALRVDAEVDLDEINIASLGALERLRPFGNSNPAPHFFARGLGHHRPLQRMGADKQHVKMWVTDGLATHEAVWWGAGEGALPVGTFDLVFEPSVNYYNGRSTPQLKVLDWRPSEPGNGTSELELGTRRTTG